MIKKVAIRILAFVLTFCTGALPILRNWQCTGIVHGKLYDGGGAFTWSRCGTDSIWISRSTESFPTGSYAKRVFEDRFHESPVERNQKAIGDRQLVDRAVIVSYDPQTGERFGAVFWLKDRTIASIRSSSVALARFC